MKRRLTINIDSELVPKAERYARSRGLSLDSLVEACLKGIASEDSASFSSRWRGRFVAAEGQDPRFDSLARKYL